MEDTRQGWCPRWKTQTSEDDITTVIWNMGDCEGVLPGGTWARSQRMNLILIWKKQRWPLQVDKQPDQRRKGVNLHSAPTAESPIWWERVVSNGRREAEKIVPTPAWRHLDEGPGLPPLQTSPSTSPGSLKKLETCPKVCKLGTLVYYKTWQTVTTFAETVTYLSGANDCQSPLYINICVPQNKWDYSWILWQVLASYFTDVQ